MEKIRISKRRIALLGVVISSLLVPMPARPGSLDDVMFLNRVQDYETIVDTTLVTQEGKRIPIPKGTRLNIAGFTRDEAFVVSRTDRPNGFVWKNDVAPRGRSSGDKEGTIREETLE